MSGVRWRRIDLHLHTPGVNSFSCPSGIGMKSATDRETVAALYAKRLADAKIEIAALTDYNGIREEWYDAIRSAADQYGILVLPGVELSLKEGRGLHILVVFAEDTEPREVNECLRSLDKLAGRSLFTEREHDEIDLRDHLHDALRQIRERFRCLLIPAHGVDDKGLIKELGAKAAAELIRDVGVDALEHAGDVRHKLTSTGLLSKAQLDTLALVEFSDPRCLEDVGGKQLSDGSPRGTWLKLSATDIDALRLALHDPQTRLSTRLPPEPRHPRVLRCEVSGSGFLGSLVVDWNPDLNALVGGRGTGKSAVLESIRYALDLEVYSEDQYRRGTVHHALGSGGVITLIVERPGERGGKRYRIRRVFGERPEVFDDDSGELLGVAPREVFGPDAEPIVLLQREIQEVSRDDSFRLRLLDVLVGEAAAGAAAKVDATLRELKENTTKLRAAEERRAQKTDLDERRRSLDKEIDFYRSQGVTEKLAVHTKIEQDQVRLGEGRTLLDEEKEGPWLKALKDLVVRIEGVEQRLAGGASVHADRLLTARSTLATLRTAVEQARTSLIAAFESASGDFEDIESSWVVATAPLRDELHRLEQEIDTKLEPERYLQLVRDRAELDPRLEAAQSAEQEIEQLLTERRRLVRTLGEQRLAESRLRRETADEVSQRLAGKLRVAVVYKGQKDSWRHDLTALFKGSGVTADAILQLSTPEATDGAQLARAAEEGIDQLAAAFDITPAMAERIRKWLLEPDQRRLRELEVLAPADSVNVELIVDGEGRPLDKLSMGQRATAILLLLFALEGRLLILDQPEDDLDNRFVFVDVVGLLREQKGLSHPHARRQVLAATHNPNIPVLGDAEQVLVLAAENGRAHILTRASIDDRQVRYHLRTVLEGGEDAFRRRAEKYGGVS
jgi:chromosome segregation protein